MQEMNTLFSFRAYQERPVRVSLIVLTVIGFFLRLAAARRVFGQDELATVRFAVSDWQAFWAHAPYDHTPPLYYLLMWVWHQSIPITEVLSRLPTIALSASAIPLCYWAFKTCGRRGISLLASCLLSFSPVMVFEGSADRAYGLLMVVTLLFLGTVFRWAAAPRRGTALAAGALAFFGAVTHLEFLLVLPAILFSWLSMRSLWSRWRTMLLISVSALLPTVIWGIASYPSHAEFSLHATWFTQLGLPKISSIFTWAAPGFVVSALTPNTIWAGAVSLIIMGFWLAAPWFVSRPLLQWKRFEIRCVVVLVVLLFLLPLVTNITTSRYYVVCYLAVLFLFAAGAATIRPRVLAICSILLFLAIAAVPQSNFLQWNRRLADASAYVQENMRPDDLLLVSPFGSAVTWRYYLPSTLRVEGVLPTRLQTKDPFADLLKNMARIIITDETAKDLSFMLRSEQRVWFLGEPPQQSNANRSYIIHSWFLKNGWEQQGPLFSDVESTITLYERVNPAPLPLQADYIPGLWLTELLAPIQQKRL